MSETVNRSWLLFESALTSDPDVDVARRHNAVERRHDVGEPLLRLQPIDIGLSRVNLGGSCVRVAVLLVCSLLRHRRRGAQRVPARSRHLRQRQVRLGLQEFALRDGDAFVELRSVDDSENVALMDLGADVLAPFLHVAAHLRMNARR